MSSFLFSHDGTQGAKKAPAEEDMGVVTALVSDLSRCLGLWSQRLAHVGNG